MALRIKLVEDPEHPDRPKFTVQGTVPYETVGSEVLKALLCDQSFGRWVPWSLIKRYPAAVRKRFVGWAWDSSMRDEDFLDILLNQPPSVVKEMVDTFKFSGNGGEMLKKGARIVGGLDGELVVKIYHKNDFVVRKYLCEHCAIEVVPLLMPLAEMYTGDKEFSTILSQRLTRI